MIQRPMFGFLLSQTAKTPEGKQLLQEQRAKLTERIRLAENAGETVPRRARKLLQKLNRVIGDTELQA